MKTNQTGPDLVVILTAHDSYLNSKLICPGFKETGILAKHSSRPNKFYIFLSRSVYFPKNSVKHVYPFNL
jgi:hypothetical protein